MHALLPDRARVFLEAAPEHYATWEATERATEVTSRGYVLAQWSTFRLDAYSDADYIAVADADTVLFAPVTPSMLFRGGRPIMRGIDKPIFWAVFVALDFPYVSEFMTGFPFVVHRGLFRSAREMVLTWMRRKRLTLAPERPALESFDAAFAALNADTHELGAYMKAHMQNVKVRLLVCAFSILGHVAYLADHDQYAWSIVPFDGYELYRRDFAHFLDLVDVKDDERCPALRGGLHIGYWTPYAGKVAVANADTHLYCTDERVATVQCESDVNASLYERVASTLMLVGRCGNRGNEPACAEVSCDECPAPLTQLLSFADEVLRLSWLDVPTPPSCAPMEALVRDYLSEVELPPPPRLNVGRPASCRWFCAQLSGRDWGGLR